jgi:hypothetical protein
MIVPVVVVMCELALSGTKTVQNVARFLAQAQGKKKGYVDVEVEL